MAKNKAREAKQKAKTTAAPKAAAPKKAAEGKEVLYRVVTKRTSDILKAYITFTYRVLHPSVSLRLVIYGLVVLLPGIFYFKDVFWKVFFIAVGAGIILLAFFRQYISLYITKQNDADYKSGAEFTYDFAINGADFLRNGERISGLSRYKEISNFYYDDKFYYLGVRERELYILPKDAFTMGDAADFEDFIYKKSKVTCRWLPATFKDQLRQRRAARRIIS